MVGILADFLTNTQTVELCLNNKIKACNEAIVITQIAYEKELKSDFLDQLNRFVDKDALQEFLVMRETGVNFNHETFRIWKLECLLRARQENDKEKVLEKVYEYFFKFHFPNDWNDKAILLYIHYPDGSPVLRDALFNISTIMFRTRYML